MSKKKWSRQTFVHERPFDVPAWEVQDAKLRRCRECGEFKWLLSGYYVSKRNADGSVKDYQRECRVCSIRRATDYKRRMREAPGGDGYRKYESQREMRRRRANPEIMEKHREASRRARARVSASPRKRAERAEAMRMRYKLKREAEGAKMRKSPANVLRADGRTERVPSAPLVGLVERRLDQRRAVEGLLEGIPPTIDSVCEELGLAARTYRKWVRGEQPTAQVGTVERILLAADVEWHELYSYDDFAHIFSTAAVPS